MESIWQKSVQLSTFPKLDGNVKTDVLIIGGGIAGMLPLQHNGIGRHITNDERQLQIKKQKPVKASAFSLYSDVFGCFVEFCLLF